MNQREQATETPIKGKVTVKKEKKPLPPLKGFLVLFICLVISFFIASIVFLAGLGLGMGFGFGGEAFSSVLVVTVAGVIIGAVIPYLLGGTVKKWGWIIGLTYAIVLSFIVPSLASAEGLGGFKYLWFLDESVEEAYLYVPIFFTSCVVTSLVASMIPRKRLTRLRFALERPVVSVAPLILISVVIFALSPVISFAIRPKPSEAATARYPKYNISFLKPKGWYNCPLREFNVAFEVEYSQDIRNRRIAEISMGKESAVFPFEMDIYIYQNMPFTGIPVESFGSREELYETLKNTLQDVEDNSGSLGGKLAEFAWYGHTEVDGLDAVRLLFREYWGDGIPGGRSPKTLKYGGEVWVYNKPDLYSISFSKKYSIFLGPADSRDEEAEKEVRDYNEIMNSIQFIKKEP